MLIRIFRLVLSFMAFYFFLMGFMLLIFPQILTKNAGAQHPIVLGMLRGAGGSIIPYSLFYIFVALNPLERRWVAFILAIANFIAMFCDLYSVFVGEYLLIYAMIDFPFELVSFLMILVFYFLVSRKERSEMVA